MDKPTTSPTANLDAKQEERTKAQKYTDSSNWGGFFKSVFKRFLWTLVFALVACNFIYLSSLDDSALDFLFPTKLSEYFPRGFHPYKQAGGEFENCQSVRKSPRHLTHIGYEWPYNMVGPLKSEWDLVQSYKNWVAVTCADSWRASRGLLKDYFRFWGPPGFFSYGPIQILVGAPLTIILSFVTFIVGGVGSFLFALQNSPGWTVIGMFLFFTWFLCGSIAGLQFLKFLQTVVLLPVMVDKEAVRNILSCNLRFIVVFFGFLVCGSAFDYLDPTIGIMMAIGFLMMTARAFMQETLELIGYA